MVRIFVNPQPSKVKMRMVLRLCFKSFTHQSTAVKKDDNRQLPLIHHLRSRIGEALWNHDIEMNGGAIDYLVDMC